MLEMFQVDTGHLSIIEQWTFLGSVGSGKLMVKFKVLHHFLIRTLGLQEKRSSTELDVALEWPACRLRKMAGGDPVHITMD